MKRFLCLSMFVALTLMSNTTFAADECTKITATGHRYYPVIAYKDGDNIVGAAPTLVETIAKQCGFGNTERMRRTFQRLFEVSPHDYRSRFRAPLLN